MVKTSQDLPQILGLACSVTFTRVINQSLEHNLLLSTCSLQEARCKRTYAQYTRPLQAVLSHKAVKLLTFADDTTLTGLVSDGKEATDRHEIYHLLSLCSKKNLVLKALKTGEMAVDLKSSHPNHPAHLSVSCWFLCSIISQHLQERLNISPFITKAQRMDFLQAAGEPQAAKDNESATLNYNH